MKIAMIGCGNGGSKVVDKCLEVEDRTGRHHITHAVSINSATADFDILDYVPADHRVLIGEAAVKGHGAGTDNTVGAEIAEGDIYKIQRAVGDIPIHKIDAFVVATSLGGGTGSGAAPVIAEHLSDSYDEPVYGLGLLPAQNEGGIYQLNTARSFPTLVENTDNVIVFDNEVWREAGETISASYDRANEEIATRFVTLFGAGERDADRAENVLDSSEIIKTLDCGGVSSIGYSTDAVDGEPSSGAGGGLLSRFTNGDRANGTTSRKETKIVGLIKQATTGQLTLPCDVSSTTKALALVTGPGQELSRSGIENGKAWLEDECDCLEVRGGDDPRDQGLVSGLVLLSGVTDVARVEEFQDQAVDAKASMERNEERVESGTQELIHDDGGEIDPL